MEPVLIIGMHRSGTSMLTRFIHESGVFIGKKGKMGPNSEAFFFQRINEWMLFQKGATWDSTNNLKFNSKFTNDNLVDVVNNRLQPIIHTRNYLDYKDLVSNGNLLECNFNWGWKDPRTTFTLPVWQKIYPEAKILHIYRNPVDVAQSLRKRAIMQEMSFRPNIKTRLKENLLIGKNQYTGSFNVMNLYNGFKLWSLYVNKALQYEGALHIKYEDLLQSPQPTLSKIIRSVNLEVDEITMALTAGQFDKSRRFAFVKSDELCTFYERIKSDPLVKKLGYSDIL